MRRAIALVVVLLVSCTSSAAPSPSPATNTDVPLPSLAPSPTPSATIVAIVTGSPVNASPTPIPPLSFADLAAAGNGVVWVLVAGDHLFRSLDRGVTWQERALPGLPRIAKISFVDDRDGWILTTGSPATGCMAQYFAVWRTTDGADTWDKAYEGDFTSGLTAGGCKSALAFVDTQHGYVSVSGRDVAPAILRSVDGGQSWALSQRLPDPPGFRFEPSVSTLAPGAVADFGPVLLVSAVSEVSGDVRRHVFRSADRGATWSYLVTTPTAIDIVFLTPRRWLQIVIANSSLETTDARASWHSFATDYARTAGVSPQIVFGDAKTGYATVRGGIQRTTDGGMHWTGLTTPGTIRLPP